MVVLILSGRLARRIGLLGPDATVPLSRFLVHLGLPALLVEIVADARWGEIRQPRIVGAPGFDATFVDAVPGGLDADCGNTGFLSIPSVRVALGRSKAMGPTLGATIVAVGLHVAAAIHMSGARPAALAVKVGGAPLGNPLLVAPVVAPLVPAFGLSLPRPAESVLKLVAAPPRAGGARSGAGGPRHEDGSGASLGRRAGRIEARGATGRDLAPREGPVWGLASSDPCGGGSGGAPDRNWAVRAA
jgi:hypothetical protein